MKPATILVAIVLVLLPDLVIAVPVDVTATGTVVFNAIGEAQLGSLDILDALGSGRDHGGTRS